MIFKTGRTFLLIALSGVVRSPLEQQIQSKQRKNKQRTQGNMLKVKKKTQCIRLTISQRSHVLFVLDVIGLRSVSSATAESISGPTSDGVVLFGNVGQTMITYRVTHACFWRHSHVVNVPLHQIHNQPRAFDDIIASMLAQTPAFSTCPHFKHSKHL